MLDTERNGLRADVFGHGAVEIHRVFVTLLASFLLIGEFTVESQSKGIRFCADSKRSVIVRGNLIEVHEVDVSSECEILMPV